MIMKQRISKQWRQGLSLPVTALTLCATLTLCVALTTACRQDDYPALHSGEPLAVTFTASVEQAAMPSATPTGNGNAPGTRTTGTGSEWLPDVPSMDWFFWTVPQPVVTCDA